MYACRIKRIFAACDPGKAGALFKCFRSELRHLQKLPSAVKTTVFFSVCHDIFCNGLTDSGNILQKGGGSRVQIHAHFIYTVLYHSAKSFSQLLLVHIMLILSHANGFRIDLHKLCKRILKPSCNRSRASLPYIKIRKFLCGKLTCRIYRSSCLVGDHIGNLLRDLLQKLHNDLF